MKKKLLYILRWFKDLCSSKEVRDYNYLKRLGVETQVGFVTLQGNPIIKKYPNSRIIIHEGVTLTSDTKYNVSGINHPVILATLSENAVIEIRKNSGLSGATICASKSVYIGENVGLGANVTIYDTDFHPLNPYERLADKQTTISKPIVINDYAWIGANTLILKGCNVGFGSVIGAGSVLRKSTEKLTIYSGNPAIFVKQIEL